MSNVLVIPDVTTVGTVTPSGAPNAPENFTLTATDGSPLVLLEWTHDGVDLDRFEILRRPTTGGSWERVVLAAAADFGTFPNYSYTAVSGENTDWVVRAMNSEGEVST